MKRVLVAPLNWGLGHATRCISVVRKLLVEGCEIVIASDGDALELLKCYFPELLFETLPSYNIRYSSSNMLWNMAFQLPKIMRTIFLEQKKTREIVEKYKIDTIISDNRFGVYDDSAHSIFMTHQLEVIIGVNAIQKIFNNRYHHHLTTNFQEVWVPDRVGFPKLSGKLSYPTSLQSLPIKYIGIQSVLIKKELPIRFKYCFLLSGPEPMRTYLEDKIIHSIGEIKESMVLIRGKVHADSITNVPPHCKVYSFLTGDELSNVLNASEVIVCRSGYSSIMDLVILEKKAVFVPTPGQTEQEYLAQYLQSQGLALCITQKDFDMKRIEENFDLLKPLNGM